MSHQLVENASAIKKNKDKKNIINQTHLLHQLSFMTGLRHKNLPGPFFEYGKMSHQARWLRRPTFADIFQVKQAASLQIFEGKIILTSLFELFMDIKINSLLS